MFRAVQYEMTVQRPSVKISSSGVHMYGILNIRE